MAHFFPQEKVVEGGSADVVKYLLENLVDDVFIDSVNGHHFQILIQNFQNKINSSYLSFSNS